MTRHDQEEWLVKKYQEAVDVADSYKRMLAIVRGGNKVEVKEIDRPDEAILKDL
jgi:hypothetical protein